MICFVYPKLTLNMSMAFIRHLIFLHALFEIFNNRDMLVSYLYVIWYT